MKKFFLDTNILIDLITEREEIIPDLKSFLFELDPSQIFLSTLSIPNTYYIFKIKSGSKLDIRVRNFISTINLVPLSAKIINSTLKSFSNNFEDTLQYYSALSEGCNHILTRDTKDFEKIKKAIPSNIEIIDTLKDLD
jgi:predicted nucleic acid-binding protein